MQLNSCIDVALTTLKNEVCSSLEQVQHRQNHCIYFHIALPIHLSCCSKRVLLGVKQQFNLHVHSISALRKETAKKSCQLVLIVGAVFVMCSLVHWKLDYNHQHHFLCCRYALFRSPALLQLAFFKMLPDHTQREQRLKTHCYLSLSFLPMC